MGWFKRDATAKPPRAAVTIIARGNKLSGQMSLTGKLHIDGQFDGEISSLDSITIGRRGEVRGVIRAHQISVSGVLDAEVFCDELCIERDGRVRGVVHSRHLSIDKRGCFIGERAVTVDSSLMSPQQLDQLHPHQSFDHLPATAAGERVLELPAEPVEDSPKSEHLTDMLEQMLGEVPSISKPKSRN